MAPLTLLIIRHAEKPKEDGDKPTEFGPGPGFTDEGEEDDKSLVIRGSGYLVPTNADVNKISVIVLPMGPLLNWL
jgi:hypothetical protein